MLCALRTDKHVCVCSTFHNLSLFKKEYDCCSPTACLVISSHRSDLYRPFPVLNVWSIFHSDPNIQRFLHLTRGLVYIYSRPKSVYDRVTWGSGGYLPKTSPLRLHVLQDGGVQRRRPIDYTNLHGGTHVRIFSHTFLKKQIFKKNLGPSPRAPGARRPHLPTPLLAPPTPGFFPASPPQN